METDTELGYYPDSKYYDSDSDSEDECMRKKCLARIEDIVRGRRFQIPRSKDLGSKTLHEITTHLFQLREIGGVDSQRRLDRVTNRYYLQFKKRNQFNMAFTMKLLEFKNLYFRKDYHKGIRVLQCLNRAMDKISVIDETYIRGKLQFNLAYAYFATNKQGKARICLERAKLHLQHTEGGEDKADMFYFEGKLMDFYAQNCKANNPNIQEHRQKAVNAYRSSRDHVLSEGCNGYLKQRAIYRSLQMCKVYLDFPEVESCRIRSTITEDDLKEAANLLQEIEPQTTLSPRLKSRLELAKAELCFRESQLCEKNGEISEAARKIDDAYHIVTNVHNDLKDTNFIEKQTSQKMQDIYQHILNRLETRLSMNRSHITSFDSPNNDSAKDTNESRFDETHYDKLGAVTAQERTVDEAYRCVMELQFSGDDHSSCETLMSLEILDRDSDCI